MNKLLCMKIDGAETDFLICAYDGKKVNVQELRDGVAGAGGYRGDVYYLSKQGKFLESSR